MKVFLLHRDRDVDLSWNPPPQHKEALIEDLELDTLWKTMAAGDEFIFEVVKRIIMAPMTDPDAIIYRQRMLSDCIDRPVVVRDMYHLAVEALASERKVWGGFLMNAPDRILSRSVQVMELLVGSLRQLRQLADDHAGEFRSPGFTRLFAMLADELSDEYFATIDEHLGELKFRRGVLLSARLGRGNKGIRHVLHRQPELSWRERISLRSRPGFSFQIPDRDDAGFRALEELRGQGINLVANALAQSADHVLSFFGMLRAELAFYVGCLNLHERLTAKGEPTCLPDPLPPGTQALRTHGLYDPCLSLRLDGRTVGNDVDADEKSLVLITGANQGGKSTFLRGLGLAHLMMQAGLFVSAESFAADLRDAVFTHFKREEDASMESGKLDEELARMSDIADHITPNSMLLCNESFASTNEREGSEIARQITKVLTEAGVKVGFVTHLYDLAHRFHRDRLDTALFLRAERRPDGHRTFRLIEGVPLPTSYGADSYRRVFGVPAETATASRRP
jgi:hypothetical protein